MVEDWKDEILNRWGSELSSSELRGKVNYQKLIYLSLMRIMLAKNGDEWTVAVTNLVNAIPESWGDEQYRQEMEEAQYEEVVYKYFMDKTGFKYGYPDNPMVNFIGRNTYGLDSGLLHEHPFWYKLKEGEDYTVISPKAEIDYRDDYSAQYGAITNLLDRKNMLMGKKFTETVSDSPEDEPVEGDS